MKRAITCALLFVWSLLCAESTKTLFMIDHNYTSTCASSTLCKHQDHLKPYHSSHNGDCVIHEKLDTLVDALIDQLNKQTQKHKNPGLIICDIDQTALTEKIPTRLRSPDKNLVAIAPILRLYKHVISQGYKVAFVTWRVDSPVDRVKTVHQLNSNGFEGFHSLHMRPIKCNVTCGQYKENIRNMLAKTYNIIATLDDLWCNLCGTNTGDCLVWVCDTNTRSKS